MNRYSNGFTIIELITVIAIIVVLATIIISNVMGYAVKARDTAVKADMHQLLTIAVDYASNNRDSLNFCTSPNYRNIASAILNINSNYVSNCMDAGTPFTTNSGVVGDFNLINGSAESSNCYPGQWYVYTQGLNNSSCWCVDSKGAAEASCGNASNCSCN